MPPAPSAPEATLVLVRVLVEAHLSTIGPRRGQRFLRAAGQLLAHEAALAEVTKIRGHDAEKGEAVKQALAWYKDQLPAFTAKL